MHIFSGVVHNSRNGMGMHDFVNKSPVRLKKKQADTTYLRSALFVIRCFV